MQLGAIIDKISITDTVRILNREDIMKNLKTALCAIAMSGSLLQPVFAEEQWDMALAYAASNYHSQNAQRFADLVKEKTGGEIVITTHPGGSLLPGNEIFRAVRTGVVEVGERFMSALGNEDPVLEIDAIPFLSASFTDARKLYEASKPVVEKKHEGMGVKLIYTAPWPPFGIYSANPINSLADLKGAKFRAQNQMVSRMAELSGAQAVTIEEAELANAFAVGVVSAMMTSAATGVDRKMWEYVSNFTDVQAAITKNMVVINLDVWNDLNADDQAAILEAGQEVESLGWKTAEDLAASAKATLAENGMTVATPSDALTADLRKIGDEMTNEWLERAGDAGTSIVAGYKNM